ncbi:hypothetical protein [Tunturibacter empetritectus]|uniref:Uncharacterized protein n=1 Tax=Tunturiibacter empetritectus TaxID=3069691 RepID=A0A7W8IHK5_9BACT|nr:hypothetical protein [Edaphobacter lichenicola]MBB5316425.1 hypothetical protein [Edaphobacter lichenicola]
MTFLRHNPSYYHMQSITPIRFVTCVGFTLSALLSAKPTPAQTNPAPQATPSVQSVSTLPPTAPTSAPAPLTPALPLTPAQEQPKHAQVTLANGILSVTADNSSLNQILRQISHETGIKIIGGVVDERVFGKYGPDAPSQILAELLDGTGSNMLLLARDGATPAQLILTPRQGGPTPPNPNAQAFDDKPDTDDAQSASEPPPAASAEPPSPRNRTAPPITPAEPASANPTDGSQPESPNGVKTPQQIYEQLQRLRQTAPPQ